MTDRDREDSESEFRGSIDHAPSGAPAVGWAIGDRFSTEEIFVRVLASAEEEIDTRKQQLFFSGLTAGFAIVLTFLGHAVGAAVFPENSLLSAVLYPVGFVYIIIGRYQLYTENTLPPVALILSRIASLPMLLRVWGVVLLGNLVGAALGVYVLANGQVLSPDAVQAGIAFTSAGLEKDWWAVFNRSIFAGWLVAGVVWLNHAARDTISRFVIIYFIFYLIAAADLYHVITAACEALFFFFITGSAPGALLVEFWLPILLGNTIGGVLLFTLVNYAQTEQRRFPTIRELNMRELLFGWYGGTKDRPDSYESVYRYFDEEEEED